MELSSLLRSCHLVGEMKMDDKSDIASQYITFFLKFGGVIIIFYLSNPDPVRESTPHYVNLRETQD